MMTTVKGELALYNQHFILGQIMQAQNPSSDLKNYSCNPIEIKLIISLYNTETGYFFELKTTLAYIMLRGDLEEVFLSYGYNKKNHKFYIRQ